MVGKVHPIGERGRKRTVSIPNNSTRVWFVLSAEGDALHPIEPDAGIVNLYQTKDSLMGHVDRSEICATSPLVSIS